MGQEENREAEKPPPQGSCGTSEPVLKRGQGIRLHLDYRQYRKEYGAGATVRELADAAGISYGAMYNGLKAAGTQFRRRGGSRRH